MRRVLCSSALLVLWLACSRSGEPDATSPPAEPAYGVPDDLPPGTEVVHVRTDQRVSASPGEPGGVVVLWPRVIPAAEIERKDGVEARVQQELLALAKQTLPGRPIDVRPEPERTCPAAGCKAVALGALILRQEAACAVVAIVMPPGTTKPTALLPWTGKLQLKRAEVSFRDPPESEVTIKDFGRCSELPGSLKAEAPAVAELLRAAAG